MLSGGDLNSVAHRLRDGKSFVACAPQAFADPSASVARWTKAMDGFVRGEQASLDAMPVERGNPWRFHRATEWKKAMDGFFHVYTAAKKYPAGRGRRRSSGRASRVDP